MVFFTEYILPILIAAFIGLFTNYLAILMLFKPYKEIRIIGIKLPFTPGLVPKEKHKIAESLSKTITNEFLNKTLLLQYLTTEEMLLKIRTLIKSTLYKIKNEEGTLNKFISKYTSLDNIEAFLNRSKEYVGNLFVNKFKEYDLSNKISKQIVSNFLSSKDNTLSKAISVFLSDKISKNIENIISEKITQYIEKDGKKEIEILFYNETKSMLNKRVDDIMKTKIIDEEKIENEAIIIYQKILETNIEKILNVIDFEKIIYDKIIQLDMKELEKMIKDITKKELQAITLLGGLLGALIGVINVLI